MSKHTPGPWEITEDDYGDEHWFGGDGNGQIQVNEWVNGGCKKHPEMWGKLQAEARLIAAAPEMLEALKDAVRDSESPGQWLDEARAAIAKATGEQA